MPVRTLLLNLVLVCLAATTGCSELDSNPAPAVEAAPADTVTQPQHDSVIGESRLPGARGVRGALDASDAAAARAAALDSAADGSRP